MPAPVVTNTGTGWFGTPATPTSTTCVFTAPNVGGSGGLRVALITFRTQPFNGTLTVSASSGWTVTSIVSAGSGGSAYPAVGVVVAVKAGGTDDCDVTLTSSAGFFAVRPGAARMWRVTRVTGAGSLSDSLTVSGAPTLAVCVASVATSGGSGSNDPPIAETAANGWTLVESNYDGGTVMANDGHARLVWFQDITADGSVTLPTYNSGSFSFSAGFQTLAACQLIPAPGGGFRLGKLGFGPRQGGFS